MSISGPSALGTLLVQRLDAVLGTTLSQQTNLVSGARPDAVSQPGQPLSPDAVQNQTARDARSTVDKVLEQTGQQLRQTTEKTKLEAQQSILAGRNAASISRTPSAPTSLSSAARAILALLQSFPEQAPPLAGKAPLVGTDSRAAPAQAGALAQGTQQSSTGSASPSTGSGSPQAGGANSNASGATPSFGGSAQGAITGGIANLAAAATGAPQNAAGIAATQFAQALSQTMQNSGLFYESHLSNLAFGTQSAASLRSEPQAQAGQHAATAQATAATPGEAAVRSGADTPQQPASGSTPAGATQNNPLAGLHPDTHLLVRQQLEVLANQTIAWRGEAWPNAPMQWDIHRENHALEHTEEASHWATRLTLNLPKLGEVQARITLAGQEVVMQLIAPESAKLLDGNRDALRAHLLASGLQVSSLSINEQPPPEVGHTPETGQPPSAPENTP